MSINNAHSLGSTGDSLESTAGSSRSASGGRGPKPAAPARGRAKSRPADRIFFGFSWGAAALIMVILAAVAIFLIVQAAPAIGANWAKNSDLTQGPTAGFGSFVQYVAPLIWGTLWASAIALVIGAPIAIGIALFISHYAPRRLAGILGYLVDLLAAVPSIVFGLWGIIVIRPLLIPLGDFLNQILGWFPPFAGTPSTTGSTILAGAVVLAVMILPIISSISREVFLQTPRLHEEAALALGATRWEMIRMAVLPYARSGVVSATLLGLGRALGETMAIALIISPSILFSTKILTEGSNSQTIAANIALNFQVSDGLQRQALIGTGLMLFVISLAVNLIARLIVARTGPNSKSGRTRGERRRDRSAAASTPTPAGAIIAGVDTNGSAT